MNTLKKAMILLFVFTGLLTASHASENLDSAENEVCIMKTNDERLLADNKLLDHLYYERGIDLVKEENKAHLRNSYIMVIMEEDGETSKITERYTDLKFQEDSYTYNKHEYEQKGQWCRGKVFFSSKKEGRHFDVFIEYFATPPLPVGLTDFATLQKEMKDKCYSVIRRIVLTSSPICISPE